MNERVVTYCFNAVGALAANYVWYATLPFGLTLLHVSAVGSNANGATIKVGIVGALESGLAEATFGDSGTPVEYEGSDFASVNPHFDAGDVLAVTVDYNGDAGTAIQNPQVVITGLVG